MSTFARNRLGKPPASKPGLDSSGLGDYNGSIVVDPVPSQHSLQRQDGLAFMAERDEAIRAKRHWLWSVALQPRSTLRRRTTARRYL
jgi:hypothetical protein